MGPGGRPEPPETRPWWPRRKILHLDRGCLQEARFHLRTWRKASKAKKNWNLPMPKMANTDLSKLLKSEEIRKVLRAPNRKIVKAARTKTNPLKYIKAMLELNPYAAVVKKNAELLADKNLAKKAALIAKKSGKPAPVDKMAKRNAKVKKTKKSKK